MELVFWVGSQLFFSPAVKSTLWISYPLHVCSNHFLVFLNHCNIGKVFQARLVVFKRQPPDATSAPLCRVRLHRPWVLWRFSLQEGAACRTRFLHVPADRTRLGVFSFLHLEVSPSSCFISKSTFAPATGPVRLLPDLDWPLSRALVLVWCWGWSSGTT